MLLANQVECLKCGDKPFSANRHDYRPCKCGAVAVDGGMEYQRLAYDDAGMFRSMVIEMDDSQVAKIRSALEEPLKAQDANECCQVFIREMKYPPIEEMLLPAAKWAIETRRNTLGLLCAFARTYRDGEFI